MGPGSSKMLKLDIKVGWLLSVGCMNGSRVRNKIRTL